MNRLIRVLLLAQILSSCTQDEVTTRDYPRVRTRPVESINESGVMFKGEVFITDGEIIDHGFIWSRSESIDSENAESIKGKKFVKVSALIS